MASAAQVGTPVAVPGTRICRAASDHLRHKNWEKRPAAGLNSPAKNFVNAASGGK